MRARIFREVVPRMPREEETLVAVVRRSAVRRQSERLSIMSTEQKDCGSSLGLPFFVFLQGAESSVNGEELSPAVKRFHPNKQSDQY